MAPYSHKEAHINRLFSAFAPCEQTQARIAQAVSRPRAMTFDESLRLDLEMDEGIVHGVYIDTLGHKTCGIGHLCRSGEPEYDMGVGEEISSARVNELYAADIAQVLKDCEWLFDDWHDLPEEVRLILANMMFNLGLPRLSKFVMLRHAIVERNWQMAADEMENSLWHRQLPARSTRLINRMRGCA